LLYGRDENRRFVVIRKTSSQEGATPDASVRVASAARGEEESGGLPQ